MQVTIIGTGYVGLTAGVCLADIGHTVICVDIDERKIHSLSQGNSPIYEAGLEKLLTKNLAEGRITFTTSVGLGMQKPDVVFFAVDTPPGEYGKANLSNLLTAVRSCAHHLSRPTIFVNKSTAPVGTVAKIKEILSQEAPKIPCSVASNPEFLSEGHAVRDFLQPNRIIVGVDDQQTANTLTELYRPIVSNEHPLIITTIPTAELIKYTSNAFLALKISFINEIADFCELVGADVNDIARGIGMDTRIGSQFLHAGIGYGGSCFGKDVKALAASGEERGFEFKIIKALATVNDLRYQIVLKKLKKHIPDLKNKTIAVLGLAFKPLTNDVRDAPSHRIIYELLEHGAYVRAYDPIAHEEFRKNFSRSNDITMAQSIYEALDEADAFLVLTEWNEFKSIDFHEAVRRMKGRLVIDGRNIFERSLVEASGFLYEGIGR
ncbi:MAG: UDP-glucose/GDP-mannose dehydrogenase family protein [bacterium]|nr:UDP-glucose/GDP-mannose dehydrogenase family protein [bacterium]